MNPLSILRAKTGPAVRTQRFDFGPSSLNPFSARARFPKILQTRAATGQTAFKIERSKE
jgi:hypothetical protein